MEQSAPRVERDPSICHGQAVVAGTRVLVSVILDALAEGLTATEIEREYPSLPAGAVGVAAAYGAELARDEYPLVANA